MLKSDADRKQMQLEHLAQVYALSHSVQSAISAIEKNDLAQIELHVAEQESICNRISCTPLPLTSAPANHFNPQLQQEIRQAYLELAQLNRVYAALLKRAHKSVALLASIYRGHETGYDRGSSPRKNTWSCEA